MLGSYRMPLKGELLELLYLESGLQSTEQSRPQPVNSGWGNLPTIPPPSTLPKSLSLGSTHPCSHCDAVLLHEERGRELLAI